jgi:hypothetical protein
LTANKLLRGPKTINLVQSDLSISDPCASGCLYYHDHSAAEVCRAARHDPLRIRDSVTQSKQRINSGSLQVPLGHQDVIRHCSQASRALTNSQASPLIDGPIQAIVFTLLKLSIQHSCQYSSLLLGTRRTRGHSRAGLPCLLYSTLL